MTNFIYTFHTVRVGHNIQKSIMIHEFSVPIKNQDTTKIQDT